MLTGLEPMRHGVLSRNEMRTDGAALQLTQRRERIAPAIWDLLDSAGVPTSVINFPATHPANSGSGIAVSDYFAAAATPAEIDQSIWPPDSRDELKSLRLSSSDIDAASLLSFIPRAAEIDPRYDPRPALLKQILSQIATVHAVATAVIAKDNWRFAAVCCMGIGQVSQAFLPYHSAALHGISNRDSEWYGDVVTGAYRFHDLMLGRFIELAGPETLVILVSNHGLRMEAPIALPKTEREWMARSRGEGIAILAGPGVTPGTLPPNANLLDVAPTLLSLFGLQATPDMRGNIWAQVQASPSLSQANSIRPVQRRDEPQSTDADGNESLAFLQSLGYQEQEDPYAKIAAENLELDRLHITALAWIAEKKPLAALPILRHITQARPAVIDYQVTLALVHLNLGQVDRFREMAEQLSRIYLNSPLAAAAMGIAEALSHNPDQAKYWLKRSENLGTNSPAWLFTELGRAYQYLQDWAKAGEMFERAIAGDARIADAHAGLSVVQLKMNEHAAASRSAQRAVECNPADPANHYQLGLALLAAKDFAGARTALETVFRTNPDSIDAMKSLALVCEKLGDATSAQAMHRRIFELQSPLHISRMKASLSVP